VPALEKALPSIAGAADACAIAPIWNVSRRDWMTDRVACHFPDAASGRDVLARVGLLLL
jgi:hypothetical protein